MSKAQGTEMLVSDDVGRLAAGKVFMVNDRCEFVANGFEELVRLYEVRWQEDDR